MMNTAAAISCFVVLVPAADALVRAARIQFDESAQRGLGAHITVLYPFMPLERVDTAILEAAAVTIAAHAQFEFQLKSVGRFPAVAYLKPEPADRFIALSSSLARAFPQYPPYGGEFDKIVPHLTVAKGNLSMATQCLDELAARLATDGPISSRCASVTLIENSSGRWQPLREFALDSGFD
jgi:2'-5' RNA ligase